MDVLYDVIDSIYTQPLWLAAFWVSLANVAMFVFTVVVGEGLVRRHRDRRITPLPGPFSGTEKLLALVCVILNAAFAVIGVVLWREGIIEIRPHGEYGALTVLLDSAVLFVAMDFSMYMFHRIAHLPLFYPLAHRTHHQYESPRPMSLFVLNPLEVIGFGTLWLVVVAVYTSSIEGILVYLTLNLVFGMVGHLGVEPAPAAWVRTPVLRYFSTSTFHAEHHGSVHYNYGFYLVVWDRLFGTLSPEYAADFDRTHQREPATT
jgi:sterol desaturase/sphingolipid hydroxylase (fatty acid hydroxylase superfamily)